VWGVVFVFVIFEEIAERGNGGGRWGNGGEGVGEKKSGGGGGGGGGGGICYMKLNNNYLIIFCIIKVGSTYKE